MPLQEFLESEVAIAVAATAALSSARVRRALRRGAIYGLAGVLMAGDALAAGTRNAGQGLQQAGAPGPQGATMGREGGGDALPRAVRAGAVSGLAKAMIAGEAIASAARGLGHDAQQAAAAMVQDAAEQAKAGAVESSIPSIQATEGVAAGTQAHPSGAPVDEEGNQDTSSPEGGKA